MPRIDDFLRLIDDPRHPPLVPDPARDGPLLRLLNAVAFSDGQLQADELALLHRVRPGHTDAELTREVAEGPADSIDYAGLRALCPSPEDRYSCLRFAARMAAMDGEIADGEWELLSVLAHQLDLDSEAVAASLAEVMATGGGADRDRIARALRHMLWEEMIPTRGAPDGPLGQVAPSNTTPVATLQDADGTALVGLYIEGFSAQMPQPCWVAWDQIVEYTRVPVPSASMHVRTRDGTLHTVHDPRLRDFGQLLDLIFGRHPLVDPRAT